jgi:hypothetical protein
MSSRKLHGSYAFRARSGRVRLIAAGMRGRGDAALFTKPPDSA